MRKDSSEKILSHGLGFLIHSSWIMAFSLKAKRLEIIAVNWGSRIGILPLLTPKGTDKQRLLIRSW